MGLAGVASSLREKEALLRAYRKPPLACSVN